MKLLRHILSHLLLISFLIAIVSVFYYRTLLLPNDVVEKVDGIVTEVYPSALKFVSKRDYFWSIRGERIVSFDDLNIFEKNSETDNADKVAILAKIETQIKPPVVNKNTPKVELKVKPEIIADKEIKPKKTDVVLNDKETNKDSIITPVTADKLLQEVVKKVVKSTTAKDDGITVVVKDSDTSSERELHISARKAFNRGATDESEKFYLELTQLDNDNPDIFGELGNVYYSQGKWDKAGQAYYEAAVRLIAQGNHNQALYLQRVIRGLDTEHAEKLAQLMMRH